MKILKLGLINIKMRIRKKIFDISFHALKRMKEREMPNPNDLGLVIANRKTKKLIRNSCPEKQIKEDNIYWTQIIDGNRFVYVTVQKNVGEYLVLTCFKYTVSNY